MHVNWIRAALVVGAASLSLAASFTHAEKSEEVAAVYGRVADYLKSQPAFSVDLSLEYTISIDDRSQWGVTEYSLAFVRPNQLAIAVNDSIIQAKIYYSGSSVITYLVPLNQYTIEPATSTPFEAILRASVGPVADALAIFGEVVATDPFEVSLRNAYNTTYLGETEINGEMYDRVNVDLDAVSWDAWITKSDPPLIYRIVPNLPVVELEMSQGLGGKHFEIDVVMDFENWNFNRPEVEQKIKFAEASTAEHVAEFTPPDSPTSPASAGPNSLLGKPAPQFELSKLDGSGFSLADETGQNIVVLDFWATWCGPCRAAMPVLQKVTSELADQGVRLYAVNLEEDPAQITTFLAENGLNVNVLLDKTSSVAAQYLVDGIPQTVIVGRDGTVQAVHVGVAPDLEQRLRNELTTLVGGESLIGTD